MFFIRELNTAAAMSAQRFQTIFDAQKAAKAAAGAQPIEIIHEPTGNVIRTVAPH